MKIVFIGTVSFSEAMLKKLISLNVQISAVLTKKKSVFNSDFVDLTLTCRKACIDCIYVDSINSKRTIDLLKKISPDIIFCFGWSELIRREVLAIPELGVIGYHPTLLPKNRGRHPLIWALALSLKETGSTFFFMDKGIDSGDILSQKKVKIGLNDNAMSLYNKMIKIASKQIEEFYPLLKKGKVCRIKQDETKANYWRKRTVNDGLINWRMSSYSIYNLVRALTRPYPGAHFIYKGREVKVWSAKEVKCSRHANLEPGKIVQLYSKKKFLIKTGENCIISNVDVDLSIRKGDYL